jgi:ADP-ribose pyrophosphatase YjhB (NUDIX family)
MSEYKFCPLCATALGEIVENGETFKHCHGCKKFTHYENPIGVAVGVIPKDNGLVLVKRKIEPRSGKHALPGGFINKLEGPREACVREVKEETGLDVEIVRPLAELRVPNRNQYLIFYLCKVTGGTLQDSDEGEAGVHALDQLPAEIAFPLHEKVIKDYVASTTSGAGQP